MKQFVIAALFLSISMLHIWFARIEWGYTLISPLFGALLFAALVGDIKDWAKGFRISTGELDDEGKEIKRLNVFKIVFIVFALWLYFCSYTDRG